MMRKRKTSDGPSARQLDKLIEEATVDAYDDEEQTTGFYTMIDDNLALPFRTRILGIEVSVVAVEMDDDGIKAVCESAGKQQRGGAARSAASFAAALRRRVDRRLTALAARRLNPAGKS